MYVEKHNKQRTVACPLVGTEVSTPVMFMLTRCQDLSSSGSSSHAKLTFSLAFSISDIPELDCLLQSLGEVHSPWCIRVKGWCSALQSCSKF